VALFISNLDVVCDFASLMIQESVVATVAIASLYEQKQIELPVKPVTVAFENKKKK
jgi:hypothetical protein